MSADDQRSPPANRHTGLVPFCIGLTLGLPGLTISCLIAWPANRFNAIYQDLDIQLPQTTAFILQIPAIVIVAALVVTFCVPFILILIQRRISLVAGVLTLIDGLVLATFSLMIAVAVYQPLVNTIEQLNDS